MAALVSDSLQPLPDFPFPESGGSDVRQYSKEAITQESVPSFLLVDTLGQIERMSPIWAVFVETRPVHSHCSIEARARFSHESSEFEARCSVDLVDVCEARESILELLDVAQGSSCIWILREKDDRERAVLAFQHSLDEYADVIFRYDDRIGWNLESGEAARERSKDVMDGSWNAHVQVTNRTDAELLAADTECGSKLNLALFFGQHDRSGPLEMIITVVRVGPLELQKLTVILQIPMLCLYGVA
jgi:hypothetical protein